MSQAVLITAYHNFDQLVQLASILSSRFEVYIHIDRNSDTSSVVFPSDIHYWSKYHVNWGGFSHLQAILFLMNEALKDPDITYFHLISGDDWPCRDLNEIYSHFEGRDEIDMLCTRFSNMTDDWYSYCSPWLKYSYYRDQINNKRIVGKIMSRAIVLLQKLLHVNRYKKLNSIFNHGEEMAQGLVWGSYPRDAVDYSLKYASENRDFMDFISKGNAPEEFFFQTILVNNNIFEKRITNKHYRYMNWTKKNGSYPGILDETDYDAIISEEYYFCRKINLSISSKLLDKLSQNSIGQINY